jgi:tetratricopeptide (TPR) repeat protein
MPYLINGIGTHYYGKKNIQTRPGPCPHCGRAVELKSYDTRKWFVIFLIPIIPLGRLRIVDYCSVCTKHIAVAADQWEAAKQTEVTTALETYQKNPTPEAAMLAHQQMLNFHQLEPAAAFRKLMRERFPQDAKIHAYLGAALEQFGQLEEAMTCYQRAYELQPDLPEARAGVAQNHLRAGRLDEARALLDFMEKPGAGQHHPLGNLNELAQAYQKAGRHNEALALFGVMQRELPSLAGERWLRDLVRKSEKALKLAESQLPPQSFRAKWFSPGNSSPAGTAWKFAAVLGLVVLGFVISNEFIRRNRALHIVNAYPAVATVQLSDRTEAIRVHGLAKLTLAEGTYHAIVSGPVQEEIEFSIRENYWSRWFGKPVWVLNLGGAAILQVTHATYAKNDPPPPTYFFSFGEKFRRFSNVTHAFEDLPEKIQVKSGQSESRTHLAVLSGEPTDLFYYYTEEKNIPAALRLAEWRLQLQPEDDTMLTLYVQAAHLDKQAERLENFLRGGLTNRPVRVPWHRLYQNLGRAEQRDAELIAEYRTLVLAEPTNSALMYLLGRVVPTRAESQDWFERACAVDTNNAFAYYARAHDRVSVGDWSGARDLLAQACSLRPEQTEFVHQYERVRFALGEYADLEKQMRAQLESQPYNYSACQRLCEVLVVQQRVSEAVAMVEKFQRNASAQAGDRVVTANRDLECYLHYLTGNFAALKQLTANQPDDAAKYHCFIAQIEAGEVLAAIQLLPPEENTANNPFHFLNTAIALRAHNQPAEATRWFNLGLAALERGDTDWKRAAAWLQSPAPRFSEHEEITLAAESKITILTAQAQLRPELRPELLPLIARLNVLPGYPQHLIRTASARVK